MNLEAVEASLKRFNLDTSLMGMLDYWFKGSPHAQKHGTGAIRANDLEKLYFFLRKLVERVEKLERSSHAEASS